MSEPENFAARWARLKRETAGEKKKTDAAQSGQQPRDAETPAAAEQGAKVAPPKAGKPPEPPLDPASLPPIESITAQSDIKAFLQSGVPEDLTRAALRRAWSADPAIRDFIGIAENQWDFTDPTAMPGFGPLETTDDIRQLVSQAMGQLGELSELPAAERVSLASEGARASETDVAPPVSAAPLQTAGMPQENACRQQGGDSEEGQHKTVVAGTQLMGSTAKTCETHNRRRHGGALPK